MTISAKCIQASLANGVPIYTIECILPINILNQLLTHRSFSRNTSSARAIPIEKAVAQVLDFPSIPLWTAKQAGMQGARITDPDKLATLNLVHEHAMVSAVSMATTMDELGVHKQDAGRYLTPFQDCKLILTATDWDNFDWLRDDTDAQPAIAALAKAIKEARDGADPYALNFDEYHVPYITRHRAVTGELEYYIEDDQGYNKVCLEHAILISMSICAQISYRKSDGSLEKAEKIVALLFEGRKVHASPSEHIATPMLATMLHVISEAAVGIDSGCSLVEALSLLQEGATSINKDGTVSSGNFTNWIQHRQLLPNHDGGLGEHVKSDPEPKGEELPDDSKSLKSFAKEFGLPPKEEFDKLSDTEQRTLILETMGTVFKNVTKN